MQEKTPIPLSNFFSVISQVAGSEQFINLIFGYILKLAPALTGTIWASLILKIIEKIATKLIIPALEDSGVVIVGFINKKDLDKKVIPYDEAIADIDTDNAFDNLISGRVVR